MVRKETLEDMQLTTLLNEGEILARRTNTYYVIKIILNSINQHIQKHNLKLSIFQQNLLKSIKREEKRLSIINHMKEAIKKNSNLINEYKQCIESTIKPLHKKSISVTEF